MSCIRKDSTLAGRDAPLRSTGTSVFGRSHGPISRCACGPESRSMQPQPVLSTLKPSVAARIRSISMNPPGSVDALGAECHRCGVDVGGSVLTAISPLSFGGCAHEPEVVPPVDPEQGFELELGDAVPGSELDTAVRISPTASEAITRPSTLTPRPDSRRDGKPPNGEPLVVRRPSRSADSGFRSIRPWWAGRPDAKTDSPR
jgi:hypothetical protein